MSPKFDWVKRKIKLLQLRKIKSFKANCWWQNLDHATFFSSSLSRIWLWTFYRLCIHKIYWCICKRNDSCIFTIKDVVCFLYFWPRKLLQSVTEISSYENGEITVLIDNYGKEKASTYKSITINQVEDIDHVDAIEEWLGFHKYVFQKT